MGRWISEGSLKVRPLRFNSKKLVPNHSRVCPKPTRPSPRILPVSSCCGVTEVSSTSIMRFSFSFETLPNNKLAEPMINI